MVNTHEVELHQASYNKDTIGYTLFPAHLEGRTRPATLFSAPLNQLLDHRSIHIFTPTQIRDLGRQEVYSLTDLLQQPASSHRPLQERLSYYLRKVIALGGEGYFMMAVFGSWMNDESVLVPNGIIPVEFESLRKEAIWKVLDTLGNKTPRERNEKPVLIARFGLDNGLPQTLGEIGSKNSVTPEWIRRIEARALRKLRHPSRSSDLDPFLPFSENSLGKTMGANIGYQLNIKRKTMADITVGIETLDELKRAFPRFGWSNPVNVLLIGLLLNDAEGISNTTIAELKAAVLSLSQ